MSETLSFQTAVPPSAKVDADVFFDILMCVGISADELVWLWTSCREVSRHCKDAVERIFISKHLKKTFLSVPGGMQFHETYGKVHLQTEFVFSGLDSNDRTRAIFHVDRSNSNKDPEFAAAVDSLVLQHLQSVFKHGNSVAHPKITIQIRHSINDTYMPDLEPKWDQFEMKINWMGMYSAWFREAKEKNRLKDEIVKKLEEKMRETRGANELDPIQSLQLVMKAMKAVHTRAWQTVRDQRIAWNVRKYGYLEDEDEVEFDPVGAQNLQSAEQELDYEEPFSDEEDNEPPVEEDMLGEGGFEEDEEDGDEEDEDEEEAWVTDDD